MTLLIQDWVTRSAERSPDATAVVGPDRSMTYAEIEILSNRIANTLRDVGCSIGDRVAVLMPKSALAVAAFVGALKADCAYVPVDPKGGDVRRAQMLRLSEPRAVLTAGCDAATIKDLSSRRALGNAQVGWLADSPMPDRADFSLGDVSERSDAAPPRVATPDDLAYVLFTSGTTGRPKGVPITHGSVTAFIDWVVDAFELQPGDRISGHTALTFDLSTFDIYAALASGAELHQVPESALLNPHAVPAFIEERGLTLWFSVPSQLAYVTDFDALEGHDVSSLRHVAWCGDTLPPRALRYWRERLPDATYTNLYGPTETTVASSHFRVPDDFDENADVPIGYALPGESLLVLDGDLAPVPDGEVGDLYIGGVGLSPGYWRARERTAEAFVSDPSSPTELIYRTGDRGRRRPDGAVEFLGRADFQIKTSGYRVEPAEVESAVRKLEEIRACAVVPVKRQGFTGSAVGCAYVPTNGKPLRTSQAKQRLVEALPGYMIPSLWLVLKELPKNDRGKIDRVKLQALMGGS